MIPEEEIKQMKILVGFFHEEMKSNSVTDLIIWLDCKLQKDKHYETQMKKGYSMYRK